MLLQIFTIGKTIKELKSNPGGFAGEQTRDVIIGVILLPLIIIVLGLAFLFILGFTKLLGGPYLFFKFVFFLGLIITLVSSFFIYKLTSFLRRTTKKIVDETVVNVSNTILK